jgi:hypothetical protein
MGEQSKIMEVNGKLYAILNWQGRKRQSDELVAAPLTDDQNRMYLRYKRQGDSDSRIMSKLFPPAHKDPTRIIIRMSTLSKKAMAELVASRLAINVPTLEKMSRHDLKKLLLALNNQQGP